MYVTRVHADLSGESHFGEVEIGLSPMEGDTMAGPLTLSSPQSAARLVFAQFTAGWLGDWHPAPRRQYWVGLRGAVEVTTSDGEVRQFGPGSVVLLEDVVGKGHVTRAVGEYGADAMLIHL